MKTTSYAMKACYDDRTIHPTKSKGETLLGLQKMARVEVGTFVGPVRHFQKSFRYISPIFFGNCDQK
jgi:hypothetical protein